jgi:hypothetical protein
VDLFGTWKSNSFTCCYGSLTIWLYWRFCCPNLVGDFDSQKKIF